MPEFPFRLLWRASLICGPLLLTGCVYPEIVDDERPAPPARKALPAPGPGPQAPSKAAPKQAAQGAAGPLRFTVTAATEPQLAAVDGRQGRPLLVLSILGDLYRLDPQGGAAIPLTRGGAYDTQPALSPDSRRVAFRSDRDGLPGIYVVPSQGISAPAQRNTLGGCQDTGFLRLTTADEYTHALPIFSADGRDVVYVRFRGAVSEPGTTWELVRQPSMGGSTQVLQQVRGEISGLTRLPTGQLVYAVLSRGGPVGPQTQLFVFPDRLPRQTVPGAVAALEAHPLGGVVARVREGKSGEKEVLAWLRLVNEPPQVLRPLRSTTSQPRIGWLQERQQYVVADGGVLLLLRPDGSLAGETHFSAPVELERMAPSPAAPAAALGAPVPHDKVLLTRSGTMIYASAGRIWQAHAAEAGRQTGAAPLTAPSELAYDPALSADGKILVYCRTGHGGAELVRMVLQAGKDDAHAKTVLYTAPGLSAPTLTGDDKTVVVTSLSPGGQAQLYRVPMAGGAAAALPLRGDGDLQATGTQGGLCYSGGAGRPGVLYRLADGATLARPLTALSSPLLQGACSPDGQAIAYVREGTAWLAPLRPDHPVTDVEALPLMAVSPYGGSSLAFAADGRLTVHTGAGVAIIAAQRALAERAALPPAAQDSIVKNAQHVQLPPLPAAPPRAKVVLRGVTLLDPEKEQVLPHTTVVIEDGSIRWVGPADRAPAPPPDAHVIDGKGRFAMPGLIEMQGRLGLFDPRAYLAYGVTAVRDVQGDHQALDFATAAEAGTFPLPRVLPSADLPQVRTQAEAQHWVSSLAEAGVPQLRLDPRLPRDLRRAAAVQALESGLRLSEQASTLEDVVNAVQDGVGLLSLQPRPLPAPQEDLLQLLSRSGVALTTLLHTAGLAEQMLRSGYPAQNTVLFELAVAKEAQAAHKAAYPGTKSAAEAPPDSRMAARVKQVQHQQQAGLRVVAGTDAGTPGSFAGVSLAWELQALGRAGIPPWQVLRMATIQAATALPQRDLGHIVAGGPADLIVLSGNPVEDLGHLERVVTTIAGGRVYRPEMLLLPKE